MLESVEIVYTKKSASRNVYEKIERIAGHVIEGGELWVICQQTAIMGIEGGQLHFHICKDGKIINVVVGESATGHKFLVSESDYPANNKLIELPEYPL